MGAELNTVRAKSLVIQIRNDGDTAWLLIGGAINRGIDIANPTEETTSQSTDGDFNEKEWVSYSDVNISVDGHPDKRTGTDPITGLARAPANLLFQKSATGNRNAKFRMISTDANYPFEVQGWFNIVAFNNGGAQSGKAAYSMSLEQKDSVAISFS